MPAQLFAATTSSLSALTPSTHSFLTPFQKKHSPTLAVGTLRSTLFASEFDIYGVPLSGAV